MKLITYISALLLLSIQSLFSQEIDSQKLDTYFDALHAQNRFMGSVAILKKGKIVYSKQIGYTNLQTKEKPNANTKYRIGSISKTFTSTLIFKAIEEGKITLEQTIDRFFPSIKNAEKITISNLLNHRSGIHNFTDEAKYLEYHTQPKNKKEMLALINENESDFTPDSKAKYSNSNFVLLSYILEDIYKKSYALILKEKITEPIKLKNTNFDTKIDLKDNECYSYNYINKWKKQPETDISIPMGAGGLNSTPTDLLIFSKALFCNEIINKSSIEQMTTFKDNYGMGIFKYPFFEKTSLGHTGGIDGFTSVWGYLRNENVGFAILSNGTNFDNNQIAITLLKGAFNMDFEIPTFKNYPVTSADLDKYLGVYSDASFPLKVTITKSDKTLVAQATGQSSFNLDAIDKDTFEFKPAGIILNFDPSKKQMILNQGGQKISLYKE